MMKYIVGFSGGIDSTFVARYLKKQGHQVKLINIKNTINRNKCCLLPTDLINVAQKLDIPLEIIDATKDFKKYIIDDFVEKYKQGLTPNPCINCNHIIRFKILDQIREKYGFDKIATGHYAKIIEQEGKFFLATAKDSSKDQTYMIYKIINLKNSNGENIIKNIEFPLGDFEKTYIRQIAKQENLPMISEKESQNICFIPDDDYPRFIKQNYSINFPKGGIFKIDGTYLGEHNGIINYTIGQKRGLNLKTNEQLFVTKIDPISNKIYVGTQEELLQNKVKIKDYFFIDDFEPKNVLGLYGKIRYRQSKSAISSIEKQKNNVIITFNDNLRAITPGQHLVLYKQKSAYDIVIGGGEII